MRPAPAELGSPLAGAIQRFVAHKRALNRRYDTEEQALRLLDRYLVERSFTDLAGVTPDVLSAVSPVRLRPRPKTTRRIPYLFDLPRARRLIEVAAALPDNNKAPQRGPTYAIIFALLYGLGLRVGEVARRQRRQARPPWQRSCGFRPTAVSPETAGTTVRYPTQTVGARRGRSRGSL
jgi:integrase